MPGLAPAPLCRARAERVQYGYLPEPQLLPSPQAPTQLSPGAPP